MGDVFYRKIKAGKGEELSVVILNRMVRKGLVEKVSLEQGPRVVGK